MALKKSPIDSTVQKAIQQRVVEHEEHNRAYKNGSHLLHPDVPPDVSTHVLPLDTVWSGRESGVDSAHCL